MQMEPLHSVGTSEVTMLELRIIKPSRMQAGKHLMRTLDKRCREYVYAACGPNRMRLSNLLFSLRIILWRNHVPSFLFS